MSRISVRISVLLSLMLVFSLFVFAACSKKEDAPKAKPGAAAPEPAKAKSGDSADLSKVFAEYDKFKDKFSRTVDVKLSLKNAEEEYESLRFLSGISDPEAKAFLDKFNGLVQRFRDQAKDLLSKDEKLQADKKDMDETTAKSGVVQVENLREWRRLWEAQRRNVMELRGKLEDTRKELLTLRNSRK